MNKGLHRTVFSKKHNTMVAVAETAGSQGKGRQAGSAAAASAHISDGLSAKLKTSLKSLVCSLVSVSMVLPAHAQITADKNAPKNQQAVILKTNTGAPLVNIQTPNAKGLSHNRYTQFDVDNKGAVLNNDRHNNPFLAKGGARLILNEVRGAASHINGIVTVGGQKADVIIANPNGIRVNGGGFKNVGRGILTTGVPQIGKDGALTGFDVRQGTVTVGQAGWNDQGGADYTEVLARAVALQGKLQGKNLAVSTGAQKTDYVSGEISAGTAAGEKPAVAIDTAALGGMYADSITLIANEKGVGVKNAGTLEAAKQLVVTSSGRIENSGRIATTAESSEAAPTYLSIETAEKDADGALIADGGKIESKGLLVLEAGEDLVLRNGAVAENSGSRPVATVLGAGRDLVVESKANVSNAKGSVSMVSDGLTVMKDAAVRAGASVYSFSKGGSGLDADVRINAENLTLLSNGSIGSSAAIEAEDGVHIEAGKPLSSATSTAGSNIRLSGGSIKAGKQLALLAEHEVHADNPQLASGGNLYIEAGKNAHLQAGQDWTARNIGVKAGGSVRLAGTGLNASEHIQAEAGTLQLEGGRLNAASGDIRLGAWAGGITLGGTHLAAGQNIDAAALKGSIVSDGLSAESARGRISLLAEGNTVLKGQHILKARTDVNLGSAGKGRLNAAEAQIEAGGDVLITSGGRLDYGGRIQGRDIRLESREDGLALRNTHTVIRQHRDSRPGLYRTARHQPALGRPYCRAFP